ADAVAAPPPAPTPQADGSAASAPPDRRDASAGQAASAPPDRRGASAGQAEPSPVPRPAPPKPEAPARAAAGSVEDVIRERSSPLVRRIAKEHNVDITQLHGTGIAGRVTKADILAFVEGQE